MKQRASFLWLFIPLTIYLALSVVLFIERSGATYKLHSSPYRLLQSSDRPLETAYTDPAVDTLVLYDSSDKDTQAIHEAVEETLDSMRVRYAEADVAHPAALNLGPYHSLVIAFRDLDHFKQMTQMVNWVEAGGRTMFAIRPFMGPSFAAIYRKLGIQSIADEDVSVLGVAFATDFLPASKGVALEGAGEFLKSDSFPVELDAGCELYLTSADEYKMPLLWEKDYGKGRFVIFNTDQLANLSNRGVIGGAYSLMQDVFAYPVINTSVYFIDDFPAPVPEGDNEVITKEFHRSISSFFTDVWWPDMRRLAEKYGLKYTGLLVETYNDSVRPPYGQDTSVDNQRYFGRLLLKSGGDIGLHGYNHVPFCMKADGKNQVFDYPVWTSAENAKLALKTLDDFGHALFPGQVFSVYVPPSNILCPEARAWLPKVVPEVKVISSLWRGIDEPTAYTQNFEEAKDGVIEFPRVVSGYYLYEDMQLALINELGLQYVNSHYIHPDDLLDPERRENRTWSTMRSQFEQHLQWLQSRTPGLRNMTVPEGATAVQRFSRLKVNARMENGAYSVRLGNFYDEAYLMLRTRQEPAAIRGGKITRVASTLYLIEANQPDITVTFRN